jgi:hypothetical protein
MSSSQHQSGLHNLIHIRSLCPPTTLPGPRADSTDSVCTSQTTSSRSQREYVNNYWDEAEEVSRETGGVLSPQFLLAWSVLENGYGTGAMARQNNYFNLRQVNNTDAARVAPWQGAVACEALSGVSNPGFACFEAERGFYYGARGAAMQVHNVWTPPAGYSCEVTAFAIARYVLATQPGATEGDIAQAIADAGFCRDGNCINGGYRRQFEGALRGVTRRAACFGLGNQNGCLVSYWSW